MIAYLQGKIAIKNPAYLVIDIGGVGYLVHISLQTYKMVESLESVRLLTHLQIREDAHTLYGFFTEEERALFILLLSVNGVGSNTARLVLSGLRPEEVRMAILAEDDGTFKRVKGIGPKTAKRIIMELKDKVEKGSDPSLSPQVKTGNTLQQEALSALIALGFPRPRAHKAVHKAIQEGKAADKLEEVIKRALKLLG